MSNDTGCSRKRRSGALASGEEVMVDTVILAGYPYEFTGILYFVFFLLMGRKRNEGIYTLRSRVLTIVAAMVMVGCVPFHYAATQTGVVVMFAIAIIAMISTVRDSATARKRAQTRNGLTPRK